LIANQERVVARAADAVGDGEVSLPAPMLLITKVSLPPPPFMAPIDGERVVARAAGVADDESVVAKSAQQAAIDRESIVAGARAVSCTKK